MNGQNLRNIQVAFPQSIPQYVEVPPDIEAKRVRSYFSAVFSRLSNPLLLKDEFTRLILFHLLASNLQLKEIRMNSPNKGESF